MQDEVEAQVLEPEKCEEWGWVPWDDLPQPRFAPLQSLLESDFRPEEDRETLDVKIAEVVQPSGRNSMAP